MRIEGDEVILESGRRVYANHGLLSVNESGELFEGYDSRVTYGDEEPPEAFTDAERADIADYMIARWQTFKEVNS